MRNLLKEAVHAGMTYVEYNLLFKQLVKEGKTTGEISEEKINYTRLNFSRTKRLDKTASIRELVGSQFPTQATCPLLEWQRPPGTWLPTSSTTWRSSPSMRRRY